MSGTDTTIARFRDLIDRYGPAFETWPHADDALWGRKLVMASLEARDIRDEALRLDALLARHGSRLDAEIAPDAADRIAERVLAALPGRAPEVRIWFSRMAAGFLVAALCGGLFEGYQSYSAQPEDSDIQLVEALVFGPAEVEMP